MENLYQIARVVMPTSAFADYSDLFVRKGEKVCYMNNELITANEYKFNTWMNMFAAKKHYFYCNLGEIYLTLFIEGSYKVKVIGSVKNVAFGVMDTVLVDETCNGNVSLKIPNAKNYEGIYFTIYENKKSPIRFVSGAWATDIPAQRDNKLAIVSCTFKREEFINKNIKLFEDYIKENPDLTDKIKLFIADNGKTLDISKNNEMVTIYPNMNAGGAGGFTRGLMEVMALDAGFTRVLFMDDDVEIFPESFYRTLMLANYLKEEYKDSIINGAMLDLYDKSRFVESMAVQTKTWVKPYHKVCDIGEYENVIDTNKFSIDIFDKNNSTKVSSAWWYCSFTIETFEKKGLPISLFFRCDDVEYSWRNQGLHHIQMNGMCVWHAPFEWRVSKVVDYYYTKRNFFLVNMLHSANYKKMMLKQLKRDFNWLMRCYDYIGCEIYLKAIKDLLNGPDTYSMNPETQFKNINEINKQLKYEECFERDELDSVVNHRPRVKKYRKNLFKLTKGGLYCPACFFKKEGVALEFCPNFLDFMLVKRVKVYNLLTNKYQIREFDRKKVLELTKEFSDLYNLVNSRYESLRDSYLIAFEKIKTRDYWVDYLGLSSMKSEKELVNV